MKTAFITLAILVAVYYLAGRHIYERVAAEVKYRHVYGATWKEHYTKDRTVTVEEDHKKLVVAVGSVVAVGALCFFIYRQVLPRRSGRRRSRRRRSHAALIPS
jgi:hypothetical protein